MRSLLQVAKRGWCLMASLTAIADNFGENMVDEQNSFLKALVNSIVDAIVTFDVKGEIVDVNTSTNRIFGYSDRELIGRNVSILIPEADAHNHD